jgi:hypothetical protein
MKKYLILFILVFALSINFVYTQDDKVETLKFEKEYSPDEVKDSYFGIGVGYTGTLVYTDVSDLSKKLTEFGFADKSLVSPIYLNGIGFFTSIPYIPNLRIGLQYAGGSKQLDYSKDTISMRSDYSLNYLGLKLDYCLVPFKSFTVAPGVEFGFGSMAFDIIQNSQALDWNNLKPDMTNKNFSHKISSNFVYIRPTVSLEYNLTNWMQVHFKVDYAVSFMNNNFLTKNQWNYNNIGGIKNIPNTVNASGLGFQLGFYFGLFNVN